MFWSQYSCVLGYFFTTQKLFEIKEGWLSIVQAAKCSALVKRFLASSCSLACLVFHFVLFCFVFVSMAELFYFKTCLHQWSGNRKFFTCGWCWKEFIISTSIIAVKAVFLPCSSKCTDVLKHITAYNKMSCFWQDMICLVFVLLIVA